ncbi:hypothetical protein N665_0322s0026 [Sinapis alba]|nr:hypothetical protein N665_0322s0026 [Sinapis alba]
MADQKDQRTDPLEEDPTFPGSQKESTPELYSDSSTDTSDDDEDMTDQFAEDSKKKKLNELKRRAFYSLLLAFRAETLLKGNKRTRIIEKLMNEWSIAQETRVSFENNIQKNLVAHQQRVDSAVKETKIEEAKPLTIRLPAMKLTYAATPSSSWGESLIGRRVLVRMPGEDEFEALVIKEFNAKDGMHRLETVDPNVMWMDETISWMDVRKVPDEDIKWRNGEKPDF